MPPLDIGGFPQAGGPALVDRFGRPLSSGPLIGAAYRKISAATAVGGETTILLKSDPISAKAIMVWKNGSLLAPPYTINGRLVSISAATASDVFVIDYLTFHPNAQDATLSALSTTAISIWGKLAEWWEMDDAVGTTITGAFAGTVLTKGGSPTFQSAAVRSGGGHSILIPSGAYFSNTSSGVSSMYNVATGAGHSVFCWFKPTAINSGTASLIYDWSSVTYNSAFGLWYDATGHPYGQYDDSGSTRATLGHSTTAISASVASHIGYTVNYSTLAVNNYSNGAVANTTSASAKPWSGAGANGTQIGGLYNFPSNYYCNGYLQDVILCKDVLTATEVSYLYNGGAGISFAAFKSAAGH